MFINCTKRNINAISILITFIVFVIMDLICINFVNSTSINNHNLESNGKSTILVDNIKNYNLLNEDTIWYLEIPKINLKALISEGTEDEVLFNYIGHFSDTATLNGNVGLAAHNRGYEKSFFKDLKKLEINDVIIYKYKNFKKIYKVNKIDEINSDDWSLLNISRENKITLITCVENEPNKRLCVQGIEIN